VSELLSLFVVHYIPHYNLHSPTPARGPLHGHASSVTGGSDPTKPLGGWTAKKWGRYRPIWSFFFCDFSIRDVAYPSPFLTATCFIG